MSEAQPVHDPDYCPYRSGTLRQPRQAPGKQLGQRGSGEIGLAPVIVSAHHVRDLCGESLIRPVVAGWGASSELLPCPSREGGVRKADQVGPPRFRRLAKAGEAGSGLVRQAQPVGTGRIDPQLRQPVANQRAYRYPGPEHVAVQGCG
jgi:hypothetical protein